MKAIIQRIDPLFCHNFTIETGFLARSFFSPLINTGPPIRPSTSALGLSNAILHEDSHKVARRLVQLSLLNMLSLTMLAPITRQHERAPA